MKCQNHWIYPTYTCNKINHFEWISPIQSGTVWLGQFQLGRNSLAWAVSFATGQLRVFTYDWSISIVQPQVPRVHLKRELESSSLRNKVWKYKSEIRLTYLTFMLPNGYTTYKTTSLLGPLIIFQTSIRSEIRLKSFQHFQKHLNRPKSSIGRE